MYSYYVSEWNPNGTADLTIVDNNSMDIVETIPEALFGRNVVYKKHDFNVVLGLHNQLELTLEYDPEIHVLLNELTKEDVVHHIACSPVDPCGEEVMVKLQKYL